ncbi:hypothetical protein QN367_06815 [Cryobacterium sp. RTS3]|uniref:hypothetical protein n=1 Tax=Cryobacterium sp. RTS3 TaxID=3048643 RepID=UPI002B231BA6|nr:hypothetical protein [Cryobacterium sp. RTS3]MEA9998804.1 hypothetical protein [Cryobacterium sp. RTS3]
MKIGVKRAVAVADHDSVIAPTPFVPKRDAAIADLKRAAESVAAVAPPLTPAQRACLAGLLGGVL